jgi:hypothetical protein
MGKPCWRHAQTNTGRLRASVPCLIRIGLLERGAPDVLGRCPPLRMHGKRTLWLDVQMSSMGPCMAT